MSQEKQPLPADTLEITSDQERRKIFLRYINRAWLILGIITLVTLPIFSDQHDVFIFLAAITFTTYLIIRFVNLSGKTRLAGVIFTLSVNFGFYGLFMFYVVQIGAYKAFETETTVWMLMGLAVLFAGALLDKRAAPILAAVNSALFIATRLITAPNSEPRPSAVVFWWMMALTVWLYESTLHEALKRSWAEVAERKQAEVALRESEEKYRRLLENAKLGIFQSSPEGKAISVNNAFAHMFGYDSPNDAMKSIKNVGTDVFADPNRRTEIIRLMAENPDLKTFESLYRRKDGSTFVGSLNSMQITDSNGKLIRLEGIIEDITERKRTENTLKLRESYLIAIIENQPGLVWLKDVDGRFLAANSAFAFSCGKQTPEEVLGKTDLDIWPRELAEKYMSDDAEVVKQKIPLHVEESIFDRGQAKWFETFKTPIFDEMGRVIGTTGFARDITERKQTENEIHQRVTELETLYESGLAINQLLSPGEIGQKVIKLLEQKLGWHYTKVHLYHPQDEILELLAFNQPGLMNETDRREVEERIKTLIAHSNQGMSGWAVQHKQVIRSNDLSNDPRYVNVYPDMKSGLYVPMKSGDRVVGVISIESERLNAFSIADERLAVTLANQAASALENARLFEETSRRFKEFAALYEISNALSVESDLNTLLKDIVEHAATLLNASIGAMYLYNQTNDNLEIVVTTSPAISIGTTLHLGEGIAGRVAQTHQSMRVENYSNWEGRSHVYDDVFFHAVLEVPMLYRGELIGVLDVAEMSDSSRTFSESDERLLSLFAAQAAGALQSARLREETARRAKEFASLYETSNAMSAENELNAMLQVIVEHARDLLGAASSGMYLYLPETRELELTADTTPYILFGTRLKLNEGVAGRVAQTRQPIRVDDYSIWEGRSPLYDGTPIRAVLEVPMLYRGELIGVLTADEVGDSERKFTETDEHLLSLFALQAAGAIHSARLREETAKRAQEFASLYETSNALSAENDLNAMLQVIVEHARDLLGAASSGMYLYLPETKELEFTVDTTPYIPFGTRLKLNEGVAGRVAQTRQPIRVDNYSTWEGRSPLYDGASVRAVVEVPMLYRGELIGVLTADEIGDSERKFTEDDEHLLSLFAIQAAGAIHSAQLHEQTARRLDHLQALHTIDRAISSSFDLRPILNTVISYTVAQLKVDAVDILLYHPHLQTLEYVAGQGFHTRAIEKTLSHLGEGHAGRAALERRTIHVPNLIEAGSTFMRSSLLAGEYFLEYYGVPLIAKGEIKGVLEVFNRSPLPRNREWADFLETLAGQAAITIDQTQLFENLQRANLELTSAYDATIEGWARAMDLRDKETENHTRRVTELTLMLGKVLGIKDNEILHIRRGALLHDIGKMGVPDSILLKKGRLTEQERVLMRQHPQFAYEMLQPIKYLQRALDIPYCHHEKWDGTGYPHGLKGEQIPLSARLFAIADVWDALTSERPYRKAWSKQKALKYIHKQNGKQFDPQVVDAFLKIFGSIEKET